MVTLAFVIFLVVHGLIHVMGFAKAFGYADLPGLTLPISPAMGVLWLVSACLFLAAAIAIYASPRVWWILGGLAVVASMVAIMPSWRDAKAGAVANAVVLAGVAFGALACGPSSLRAAYDRDVRAELLASRAARGARRDRRGPRAICPCPCSATFARVAWSGSPAFWTCSCACTDASAARPTHPGCRSRPSSTARGATGRRACST